MEAKEQRACQFLKVREKRGLVYSIYSFPTSFIDSGLFGIYAGTGEKEVAELIPLVCTEMVKLTSDVTEMEVARAKALVKTTCQPKSLRNQPDFFGELRFA